jgi:hypothetical protein
MYRKDACSSTEEATVSPVNDRPDGASKPPRWVVVSAVIAGLVVVVFVVVMLVGGGEHGPGMHDMGAPGPVGTTAAG